VRELIDPPKLDARGLRVDGCEITSVQLWISAGTGDVTDPDLPVHPTQVELRDPRRIEYGLLPFDPSANTAIDGSIAGGVIEEERPQGPFGLR
jgi:hypothetical protein